MAVCFLNDISTLETEQLIIPEKLGSGENRGDFDYLQSGMINLLDAETLA